MTFVFYDNSLLSDQNIMIYERWNCIRILWGNKHKLKGCFIIFVSKFGLTCVKHWNYKFLCGQTIQPKINRHLVPTNCHPHSLFLYPKLITYWITSTCTYQILQSIVPQLYLFPTINHAWHVSIGLWEWKPPYQKFLLILEQLFINNPR